MDNTFKLMNPFKMNDWNILKLFNIILALQLSLFGAIALDFIGLEIPLLRQITGFIYLVFIPGTLVLRILRMHKLGTIETVIYTVGISISILMFIGLFTNVFFDSLGFSKPMSTLPLFVIMSIFILILCTASYIVDKNFVDESLIEIRCILSSSTLFLCLIPFFCVFGTYLVNYYQYNILIFILLFILSVMPISVVFFNFPKENLYPYLVFVIAISLLYHWSLIGNYLSGGDIHYEYHFSNLVVLNGIWDSQISNNVNSMLSIVMLAPTLSKICNLNLIWVFKIIYPLLYTLVPLGLYNLFQKQIDKKSAFLSTFFFMAVFPFFSEMLQLARQQIAEIFLIALLLLMLDDSIKNRNRVILSILFAISLAISHYGLSYIYLLLLFASFLLLHIDTLYGHPKSKITLNFLLIYLTFIFTWYSNTASSSIFNTIVHIGDEIIGSFERSVYDTSNSQGLSMIINNYSALHEICKYFYLFSQMFIFIGVIQLFFRSNISRFTREYRAFSIVSLVLCLSGIIIPNFASALNTTRLFHISLFFLAPFFFIGLDSLFGVFNTFKKLKYHIVPKIFSIYLLFFLLLTSGFFYEIAGDKPVSIALNSTFDAAVYNEKEVSGTIWIKNVIFNSNIYADAFGKYLLDGLPSTNKILFLKNDSKNGYLYLRQTNINNGLILTYNETNKLSKATYQNLDEMNICVFSNKIYSNGGSDLLLIDE